MRPANTPEGPRAVAERSIVYQRLAEVRGADVNPKQHDTIGIDRSISEFGLAELPLLDERTGRIVAGHGRIDDLRARHAAHEKAPPDVRVDEAGDWWVPLQAGWSSADDAHARAYLAASNKLTATGGWDLDVLPGFLDDLDGQGLLELTGFTDDELAAMLADGEPGEGDGAGGDPDAIPDTAGDDADAVTRPGDLWELGPHRLICGDTTDPQTVARLFEGLDPASCVHADPPYGMGKEADGVANDNLYREKLDAFQNAWWAAWSPNTTPNASVYVWGNAPDLWRWWWSGGLADWTGPHGPADRLLTRNEIVWDKGSSQASGTQGAHSYPVASERCLFLMRGQQFLGNQNKDEYHEGYEPFRLYLCQQRDQAGWSTGDVNRITGTQMAGHWFGRSQFALIGRDHYERLAAAAAGAAFTDAYDDLFGTLFPGVRDGGNAARRDLSAAMRETRTWFDNTHAAMTDVWQFGRVTGEERHGHATPKPVDLVQRALASSSRRGDVIAVPFAGTGPEFIAAHRLGHRTVVAAELSPVYVDTVCARWQAYTGVLPVRDQTPHDFLADQRPGGGTGSDS